ncbi:MAG: FHA domain-containing protein [Lachnospiraceae bacterium]|nr:FHA domain-containing protein [Lachnospiraceae bacterium]
MAVFGVIILIVVIVLILYHANRELENVDEEGESFVDEWALREEKKEELRMKKLERRQEESTEAEEIFLYDEETEESAEEEMKIPAEQTNKIVPMEQIQNTGITLLKLDDNHRVTGRYRVNRIPFTIGRSEKNNLVLDDLCVARNHCRIVKADGRYILEDEGTMNRLFVNGASTDRVLLSDGMRISIGNEEFQVEMEDGRSQSTRLYNNVRTGIYE